NFGLFLDSSPDRWGRVLMQRREAQQARAEERNVRPLLESDYLLGVYDGLRMGALRFRLGDDEPFLDNQKDMAAPPWTKLRDLEYASLQLEQDDAESNKDYMKWLKMLIAPGGSLGGARPKASVLDENSHPWIAKFPSRRDEINVGKWEYLVYQLARKVGIVIAHSDIRHFSGEYDTFLTKRFDRTEKGERLHFASAMTLLGKKDGDGGDTGVSYLDLADFLVRNGSRANDDLEQLWRRIVFYVCVSNTDDHLRNHGFMLTDTGWTLSPAYDINPVATGGGLALNITKEDNSQDLDLALSIAPYFRVSKDRANEIIQEITTVVRSWPNMAKRLSIPSRELSVMKNAFRAADESR
ncbi:MAG: HipA domain-containing protein, partial [Desulforhopalus sp.]